MSNRRVRLRGTPVTHGVRWQDDVGGTAHCGVGFAWRAYAQIPEAYPVDDDCDCMTCLVNEDRGIGFSAYQEVGVSVINAAAIGKLKLFDEE